jgi:hypothetical protein
MKIRFEFSSNTHTDSSHYAHKNSHSRKIERKRYTHMAPHNTEQASISSSTPIQKTTRRAFPHLDMEMKTNSEDRVQQLLNDHMNWNNQSIGAGAS